MRLLLVLALAFFGLACDKTIHEVRLSPPPSHSIQPPIPPAQPA